MAARLRTVLARAERLALVGWLQTSDGSPAPWPAGRTRCVGCGACFPATGRFLCAACDWVDLDAEWEKECAAQKERVNVRAPASPRYPARVSLTAHPSPLYNK